MISRLPRRLATDLPKISQRRCFRKERGPKSFGTAMKELALSFMGGFTIRGAINDFVNDVKFITGPVSNYLDAALPVRIDKNQAVGRFVKTHCDAEYGGLSHCSTKILYEEKRDQSESEIEIDDSYVRFEGELNFPENRDAKVKTSGFCATQAVCKKVLDLVDHEGIELIIRSKEPRFYIFGMKTMSLAMLNDMQYQIKLDIPGGNEWLQYHIPWSYFSLTRGGKICEMQRVSDNMKLASVTFLVIKEQGPFQLDIRSITALPELNTVVVKKMLPFREGQFGNSGKPYK